MNKRIVVYFVVSLFLVSMSMVSRCEASDKYQLKLNLLPWSYHHGSNSATNERHRGVGLSLTLPNDITYGVMHYKNSYGDNGWNYSVSTEFDPYFWGIKPGLGVAYAPAYEKSGHQVVIGWLSLRYKWISLLTAPGEVSTIMLSIPIK